MEGTVEKLDLEADTPEIYKAILLAIIERLRRGLWIVGVFVEPQKDAQGMWLGVPTSDEQLDKANMCLMGHVGYVRRGKPHSEDYNSKFSNFLARKLFPKASEDYFNYYGAGGHLAQWNNEQKSPEPIIEKLQEVADGITV